ncbi:HNH endonuclease [Brevibacterium sp. 91QC2O2]|uniref:HNH endonuclease n=1 Tax=Brevibacterium TaxID=1696 RepID=UPI00211CA23A|nr:MULTISPECIES: HNH endonuclease [unclassified Brevibacterium]MCQ9367353.1 HNH endonuclease [Brevibacterium sp. 91QC2O2]MCQ9384634.1 HNH endonuclease [Brevibacterium sp. 68QC2CO]
MAASRTGTTKWMRIRDRRIQAAINDGLTHCPRCRVVLDYERGKRPNSVEVDHIVPASLGGLDVYENTQVVCRRCNQSMGDKQPRRRKQVRRAREIRPTVAARW